MYWRHLQTTVSHHVELLSNQEMPRLPREFRELGRLVRYQPQEVGRLDH